MANRTQFERVGDTLVITYCNGETVEIPLCCTDDGTDNGGGFPPIQNGDRNKCNIANEVYLKLRQTWSNIASVFQALPVSSPLAPAAIWSLIASNQLPAIDYLPIFNWLLQHNIAAARTQYINNWSDAEDDALRCALYACILGATDFTADAIDCWRLAFRALQTPGNPTNSVLESMYGLLGSISFSVWKGEAFEASLQAEIADNCEICSEGGGQPSPCGDNATFQWVTYNFDSPLISGGDPACYGSGNFSGGVCPNSLLVYDYIELEFPSPTCISRVHFNPLGNTAGDWVGAKLIVDGLVVEQIQVPNSFAAGDQRRLRCEPLPYVRAFYEFELSQPLQVTKIRLEPIQLKIVKPEFQGVHIPCIKISRVV